MGKPLKTVLDLASLWLPGFEPEEVVQTQPDVIASAVLSEVLITQPTDDGQYLELLTAEPVLAQETVMLEEVEPEPVQATRTWPEFLDSLMASATGMAERISQNLNVIKQLQAIRSAGTAVTQEIRHSLLQYSGWGGVARLFSASSGSSLEPQRAELEALLGSEAYASARSGILTAYYTHPDVIRVMWEMVRRLGFSGGRVIEPAAGSGRFIACMPADMAAASEITAVEADQFSAELLQTTFDSLGVRVLHSPVEKAGLPDGHYDLAITNVPFGEFKSCETRKVPYAEFSLHNYFVAKCIDLVRPGGLVAVITSSYTMDSDRLAHRKWISAQAELVMALRLPNNAFTHTGTEVVSDLLLFKRREAPAFAAPCTWLETVRPRNSQVLAINSYFAERPQHVLGDLCAEAGQYGRYTMNCRAKGGLEALVTMLKGMLNELPDGLYQPRVLQDDNAVPSLVTVRATHGVKPGAFVLHNDRIHVAEDAMNWIDVDDAYTGRLRARLLGIIGLRDKVRQLIELQLKTDDDTELRPIQTELTIKYDRFFADFGHINDQGNVRVFKNDPDCPLLLSLESYDEVAETYKKAAIFSRRTVGKAEPPAKVDTVKDAMLVSLGLYGAIRLRDMATRKGCSRKAIINDLESQNLAFQDPADGEWKPAEEYLSGFIRNKIAVATAAGARFKRNVEALTSVIPADLGPKDVDVRLGSTWVPTDVIADFACDLLNVNDSDRANLAVAFNPDTTTWSILRHGREDANPYCGEHGLVRRKWGTDDRSAWEILVAALNQQPPKITRTVNGSTYVDTVATMAAREKYEAIKLRFREWAYADADRQRRLLRIYNDEFNQIVERKFDGSHLTLPGVSRAIQPYQHQLDAIWRIITVGNVLLAHVVGAGKSFTMIAAAMELRRLGKARKSLIVVPNHLLYQFVGECLQFYPTAQILMTTKEDMEADRRKLFAAKVATGDWDAVVMTHSAWEKLALRPEAQQAFIDEMLANFEAVGRIQADRSGTRGLKAMEKRLKSLRAKLEKGADRASKDDLVYFEHLGCDQVMFDEAHYLKNLLRISKMPNIAGLPNASSRRALDALLKFQYIMKQRGHREEGIVLATGTPVSNSMAEMHVMMRYLMPMTLKSVGLYEFDAWAANFGEAVTGMELAPDGSGFRLQTRFSKFVNVPELMAIFRQVADIKTRKMVKLPTPRIKGGKPTVIACEPSAELLDYTQSLIKRAENVRSRASKPKEDNMLKITSEGRKAALDMRLIAPGLPADPFGKVAAVVKECIRIWHETHDRKGVQLIFSDIGTPNGADFSVYHAIRDGLISNGVPPHEIEFIHDHESDAAKAKLFRKVRAGSVRFLLGSTLKMGTGTNVQALLKAVHSLDAPWRPSDIEQRDGRGERAGNTWDEIELLRYVTKQSFDSYIWQLLDVKARFIEQVMNGESGTRTVEDLSMGALSYAEIKAIASGNPMVLEAATVSAEIARLNMLYADWEQNIWNARREIRWLTSEIELATQKLPDATILATKLQATMAAGIVFQVGGVTVPTERGIHAVVGEAILLTSRTFKGKTSATVGSLCGFTLKLYRDEQDLEMGLEAPSGETFGIPRRGLRLIDIEQMGELVVEKIHSLAQRPQSLARLITDYTSRLESAREFEQQPFDLADKLSQLTQRKAEIEKLLDTSKDEAGTDAEVEAPQGEAALAEETC